MLDHSENLLAWHQQKVGIFTLISLTVQNQVLHARFALVLFLNLHRD